MTIGERIRETRKFVGMTQAHLAEASGVAAISIHQYEAGKREPRIEQLRHIAEAMGFSVDYLLSGGEQVSQTHLANGIHIYKNTFPFKVIEPFLADSSSNSRNIVYQDEYLLIAVDENAAVTPDELDKIVDAYAPYREKQIDAQRDNSRQRIENALNQMNLTGRCKVADYAEDILPRYRAEAAPQSPPSTSGDTDTPTQQNPAEGPQETEEGE